MHEKCPCATSPRVPYKIITTSLKGQPLGGAVSLSAECKHEKLTKTFREFIQCLRNSGSPNIRMKHTIVIHCNNSNYHQKSPATLFQLF
jgi:hypothetical protein